MDFSASFNRRRVQICSCSSWICSMLRPHNSQHCANIVTFSPGFRFFCSVSGCFCTFLELYRCNIFFHKKQLHCPQPRSVHLSCWESIEIPRPMTSNMRSSARCHDFPVRHRRVTMKTRCFMAGCGTTTNLPYCIIIIIIIFNYAACCTSDLIPAKVHTVKSSMFSVLSILLLHVDAPPT